MRLHLAAAALLLATGCATAPPVPDTAGIDAVLIGEQHDAKSHARVHERWVRTLAERGTLAALALEMAERGGSTAGLPRNASEEDVQQALRWSKGSWPWARYSPAIMAAVRAGVPVVGANLPRDQNREAMKDDVLDKLLPAAVLAAQQEAVRVGHCDMLPPQQIAPMARIQIARDVAMAQVVSSLVQPGKTVLLLAGSGHVRRDAGVPLHLPQALRVQPVMLKGEETGRDYCAEFKAQMPKKG